MKVQKYNKSIKFKNYNLKIFLTKILSYKNLIRMYVQTCYGLKVFNPCHLNSLSNGLEHETPLLPFHKLIRLRKVS